MDDGELYDEFGNYIGPPIDESDEDESFEEESDRGEQIDTVSKKI